MSPLAHYNDFTVEELHRIKNDHPGGHGSDATTVTVALPARNEASTIGGIIGKIRTELVDEIPLVDELIVIDDQSSDDTSAIARAAGATVFPANKVLPSFDRRVNGVVQGGKGEALWKSLHVSTGELVIWCDADIRNFDVRFILGCLGPLLADPSANFVKGFYQRPLRDDGEGGGRVTELVARPLIAAMYSHLGHLIQPLSGEFGGRRHVLEAVPFSRGYAVDLALLIDIAAQFGVGTIKQVDLGTRIHRNRPLRELGPQSMAIMSMALHKHGLTTDENEILLARPGIGDQTVQVGELPALSTIND